MVEYKIKGGGVHGRVVKVVDFNHLPLTAVGLNPDRNLDSFM
jgi:hypothetical protein